MPTKGEKEGLLLDTHVWIWLNTATELSSSTVALIDQAARNGRVCIPAIAVWELATLVEKRKILLKMPIESWVCEALSQPGVELLPLLPEIAIESAQLPEGFHADPADRIIVASARIARLRLVTRDARILAYGRAGHVDIIKG